MAIGIAIDGFAALVTDRYLMPRLNLFFLLVVGSLTLTGARYLSRLMARQRRGPARLILVGPANERARVREIIENEQPSSEVVFESQSLDDLQDQSQHDVTDILILDIDTMARTDSASSFEWRSRNRFTNEFHPSKQCQPAGRAPNFSSHSLASIRRGSISSIST